MTSGGVAVAAEPTATPFISELHYDNAGTDSGEAIEVQAPVGFDLSGWQIVLYNGNGGAAYNARTLNGTVPAAGVIVAEYPVDGIQNGSPDGIALVAPGGTVAEFLTYEGTFTAVGGPANGLAGTDIGVAETSTTPVGHSLQKVDGTWRDAAPNTFGTINGGGGDPDPEPIGCAVTVDHTIGEVQGTGDATPLAGARVTVEGVVTADHRTGGYNGIYLQTAGSGGRAPAAGTASAGIFVYLTGNTANHPSLAVGDRVRVSGTANEFNGLTQISIGARTDVQVCEQGVALPAPVPLSLPLDAAGRESVESMLVAPVGQFTVSEVYNLNRFGEVVLAAGDKAAPIPTDLARPGTPQAQQIAADNKLRRLLLDDGRTTNLSNAGLLPPYLSPTNPVRVGDHVEAFGPTVLSYGFNEWRMQPTTPVNADTPPAGRTTFKVTNPRTAAPENVGGDVKVASFNVLNYFVHFGGDARGAADEASLAKQEAKIVTAINALGADVIGLQEIENSVRFNADDPQQALKRLVGALNTAAGAGTWDYVRYPATLPPVAQQDVITTAIIFKPAKVRPQGEPRALNDETVWFNAREPIAQTFKAGGLTFTVVTNHLKSKGGSGTGDNADAGDGQGAFNGDRVRQARSLVAFVDQLKADSGSDNVLLLGDFNAYTHEDPMQVLYDAKYVDLNTTGKASYVFSGESGSLDHAVASPSLASRVTGVDVWQINSHESYAFQYNGHPAFYAPNQYRASDHNPIVVGLRTTAGPVDLQLLSINDFHGRLESPATVNGQPVGGAAKLAGLVNQLRAQNPNTAFVSAGDNIGASTFISAIDDDNPTLDALNAMGLAVSAVGNHEFDQGIADLTGRVADRADFPYLGANVYRDDERALPAYSISTVGGVKLGFIGVVTEQTKSLVSPDGIAGLEFRDAVAEANAVAGQLKDGDPANGEADVVVLLAHEGAAEENIDSAEELANDPVFGKYTRADATIDVILSGHTHQPYALKVPVPGTDKLRPVLQAEDYGLKLGRVSLTYDPATKSVTSAEPQLVDVVGAPQDPAVAEIVAAAKTRAAELGQRPLGSITADIKRAYTNGAEDRGKESVLGNFIADVQLAGTKDAGRGGAQIAFMNPGGLRADLLYAPDGVVTYAEAFAVQPFANDVVTRTYTGAQIKQVLEEQWQPAGASRPVLWLGVSKGFSYTYLPDAPRGSRITSMKLNGTPISPTGTYRVTMNSFLAAGGDNFVTLPKGTDVVTTGDNDLTMLTAYFAANSPVTADTAPRSTVGEPAPECTTTITGRYSRPLTVTAGVTCLDNAIVSGPVTVARGASLISTGGTVSGPVRATNPVLFTLSGTTVSGPVMVTGATGVVVVEKGRITGPVSLTGNTGGVSLDDVTISGPVLVSGNTGGEPVLVAQNTISGPLGCSGNDPAPGNDGRPNTVSGPATGQCAKL
ncbi:multifunctional 2',3'-cyclic-nucleotide 2'-phosphodiesterase/5'-nucleotidase/3'-nucleotidase [Micromonospora deserti]|uniref:Multifunctional 2',3'-cyclic-nucleotide 2'-phosphodiesterase/5'-nucleotidase/3'-nucleotidase n=1 Tax=Micromonospora deserti TaxID=2070366 RepID=A0A2W2DWN8_9ACTN|nr:multifunctional 2',3'-cyclic-nucleotide 2'-phosphodiesterase/5'-nucleotidase/3'-nucleotidase [Micromonospora deserti]